MGVRSDSNLPENREVATKTSAQLAIATKIASSSASFEEPRLLGEFAGADHGRTRLHFTFSTIANSKPARIHKHDES